MTTVDLTSADTRIRNSVLEQLGWDRAVDATEIGVAARHAHR